MLPGDGYCFYYAMFFALPRLQTSPLAPGMALEIRPTANVKTQKQAFGFHSKPTQKGEVKAGSDAANRMKGNGRASGRGRGRSLNFKGGRGSGSSTYFSTLDGDAPNPTTSEPTGSATSDVPVDIVYPGPSTSPLGSEGAGPSSAPQEPVGDTSHPLNGNGNTGSSSSTQPQSGFSHLHSNYKTVDQCTDPDVIKAKLTALKERLGDDSALESFVEFYLANSKDKAETAATLCRSLASLAAQASKPVIFVEPKSVAECACAILDSYLSQNKYGRFRKIVPGVFVDIAKVDSFWKTKDLDLSPFHLDGGVVGFHFFFGTLKQILSTVET